MLQLSRRRITWDASLVASTACFRDMRGSSSSGGSTRALHRIATCGGGWGLWWLSGSNRRCYRYPSTCLPAGTLSIGINGYNFQESLASADPSVAESRDGSAVSTHDLCSRCQNVANPSAERGRVLAAKHPEKQNFWVVVVPPSPSPAASVPSLLVPVVPLADECGRWSCVHGLGQ